MKKAILIIGVLYSILSTSCNKEKTCQCTHYDTGKIDNLPIQKAEKSQQETACKNYESTSLSCELLDNTDALDN